MQKTNVRQRDPVRYARIKAEQDSLMRQAEGNWHFCLKRYKRNIKLLNTLYEAYLGLQRKET